jgi:exosortase E/protease (VPEID-CTERM system)
LIPVEVAGIGKLEGGTRALLGASILAVEYLALGVSFDGAVLAKQREWWAALYNVGAVFSIGVAVFTAGLLVRGGELLGRIRDACMRLAPLEPRWAVLHAAAFALFTLACSVVFGDAKSSAFGMTVAIAGWLVSGSLTFATLFRFTFGSAWRLVAKALSGLLAAGLVLGLTAWVVGEQSLPLWSWLAGAALHTSAFMLAPFAESVRVVPAETLLGIDDFDVTIAAECSGMENFGATLVFVLGYLYAFRERLRLPRSLLLLPLALVAVWLFNCVRIATLVAIGAYWSPDVALGGFHSKAGWLALCLVALGVVLITRNSPRFAHTTSPVAFTETPTAAYLLPLLTFTGVGLVTELFTTDLDRLYPLRIVAGGAVAWHYRNTYPEILGRVSIWGVAMGVVAFALWVVLSKASDPVVVAGHQRSLEAMSGWSHVSWLAFRVVGAVVVVPVVEELAFRGFLQRRLVAEDFSAVPQGKFTPLSLAVSALAFGMLHPSWVAGFAAGVVYSITCHRSGRLGDAVVAHATTNGLLVVAGLGFGRHELWQ